MTSIVRTTSSGEPTNAITQTNKIIEEPKKIAKVQRTMDEYSTKTQTPDKSEKHAIKSTENKQENHAGESGTQSDQKRSIETQNSEAKRTTRNLLTGSPAVQKRKVNSNQASDRGSESNISGEGATKKNKSKLTETRVGRKRKDVKQNASIGRPPTNRQTRKSTIKNMGTTITQKRGRPKGVNKKEEQPENSTKRKYTIRKKLDNIPVMAVKRKRSLSPKPSIEEIEAKLNKTEDLQNEFDLNSITIKQEIVESGEELASDVASDITVLSTLEPVGKKSLRTRKLITTYSPTTRPYKRRKRLNRPDEDSKDSMGSSILDDTLSEIKVEKFQSMSEDTIAEINLPPSDTAQDIVSESLKPELNGIPVEKLEEDLITDFVLNTETIEVPDRYTSTEPEVAPSPDSANEGLTQISVNRFYNKTKTDEFQQQNSQSREVTPNDEDALDDITDKTNISIDSIKEGELICEEEEEDEEIASIGSIPNDNDDGNSVSTGFISPLLMEDDDDEEDDENLTLNADDDLRTSSPQPISSAMEDTLAEDLDLENNLKLELDALNAAAYSPETAASRTESTDIVEKCTHKTKEEDLVNDSTLNSLQEDDDKKHIETDIKLIKPLIQENQGELADGDQEENKENVGLLIDIKEKKENVSERIELLEKESIGKGSQEKVSKNTGNEDTSAQNPISAESIAPSTSRSHLLHAMKTLSIPRTPENDERLRQKERHLKTLGLLTHKAADEAILAKQKRRKFLHNIKKNISNHPTAVNATPPASAQNKSSQEYTGTLKTVIKLNRQMSNSTPSTNTNEAPLKKGKTLVTETITKAAAAGQVRRRQSLKMTFQKGRGRPQSSHEKNSEQPTNNSMDDSYYTIQNEPKETVTTSTTSLTTTTTTPTVVTTATHGRKSHNRSIAAETTNTTDNQDAANAGKKDEKETILIPEKASSFKFHPGRLCQDQCYYCSGKFGLYDTPCHVGQIKSKERQQKILTNEEKLTVDNCLCDACFRHVDRRANAQQNKKRATPPGHAEIPTTTTITAPDEIQIEPDKQQPIQGSGTPGNPTHICAVLDCGEIAPHALRRKGIRKGVKKTLLNFDMSNVGAYIHVCSEHHELVIKSNGCALCKRRLGKNNMYHITTDTIKLEKALAAKGIPVTLGQGTAVCKLCRYFANLVLKPPETCKIQKVEFVKNYRKRLLHFHNIHEKKDTSQDEDEEEREDDPIERQPPHATKSSGPETKETQGQKSVADEKEPPKSPPSPAQSSSSSVEVVCDASTLGTDDNPQPSTSSAALAALANGSSNQIVLDNDVMVDYDVPMISDSSSSSVSSKATSPEPDKRKKSKDDDSKLKSILQNVGSPLDDRSDISNVLRSNPNISMRELFPGEEDLGVQFKAPFGCSSSQRTPEGWTRVNTFLQYDEPTRRLWEELQKPYGNQSSFLRHLILLEKYHRNGDLILSSNASSNATVYTQTVRSRLQSYDGQYTAMSSNSKESECRSRSLSVEKIQKQLSTNSVTITARPKDMKQQKNPENSKQKNDSATNLAPTKNGSTINSSTPNSRSVLKANLFTPPGTDLVPITDLSSNSNNPSPNTSFNDSSTLTKQQKIVAAANKLLSNKLESSYQKKSSLNTAPPDLISLHRRTGSSTSHNPSTSTATHSIKRPQLLPKPIGSGKLIPPNVIILPDTLTPQERMESKSWRPTLLPVSSSTHHINNQQGPLYQTADGRRLPALVQVQSSGKPFLISIHDYNRMCILRREKLLREQMLQDNKDGAQFSISSSNNNNNNNNNSSSSNSNNSSSNKHSAQLAAIQSYNKALQTVNAAEQAAKRRRFATNSKVNYMPIAPKPLQVTTTATVTSASSLNSSQQQQQPQQSQAQNQMQHQQHQQSSGHPTLILPAGTLQPINLIPNQNSSLSILPNFSGQVLPILNTSSTSSTTISGVPNSWLWNNFPDSNQLINGKTTVPKGSQGTGKQQSLLIDNVLMSKIPKSLTVIPQHKLMPASIASSSNSASGGGNISKN